MKSRRAACIIFAIAAIARGAAQSAPPAVDLNEYYKYPVSIGFEYQGISSFTALNVPYSIFDFAGIVTVPVPGLPVLQPFVRAGYVRFNSLDTQFPGKWDQDQFYGVLGLGYVQKIAKNFEVGADASAGFAEALFPSVAGSGPLSSPYLLFGAGVKLSLTPSYGFSIDFHPGVRYQLSLSPFTMLDGFLLTIGVSAGYRFGEDPDSARSIIRSLRFGEAAIPPAFSAMQSYYASNPIGHVTVTNTEKQPVTDVEISFNQKEYMDAATPCLSLPSIDPGKSVEVPLKAVFNSKVYDLEGGMGFTPLTGEIVATYRLGGRSAEQRSAVTYNLYDKRAMTWDDDRKAAAFITPLDRALKNYTAFINEASKQKALTGWNQSIQIAMQDYDALREIGIYYQDDPAAPFSRVQGDKTFVDFISMPRDTLSRRYGDCKNLTVLYCSLLETKSVRTGFITVPGHIFPVFDTGQAAGDFREIHPDRSMTLAVDGTLWVPVEVTMLDGKSDFLAAWKRAIEEWKTYEKDRRFYRTGDAQAVFAPVALQQVDLGLQYGRADAVANLFASDLDALGRTIVDGQSADAEKTRDKKDYNRLGILAAKFLLLKDAEEAFGKALKIDPGYVSALINLGNLSFVKHDYRKAISSYMSVIPLVGQPTKGSAAARTSVIVLVNAARAYDALKQQKESEGLIAQASVIDADQLKKLAVAPPGSTGSGSTRAANASESGVEFLEE